MAVVTAGSTEPSDAGTHLPVSAKMGRKARTRVVNIVCYVVLVISAAIVLLPLFWLLETAFKSPLDAYVMPPKFVFTPTLVNFKDLLQNQSDQFAQDLVHSLVLLACSVSVALVLGTPAGFALSRSKFRGSRAVSLGLIAIYIAPALVYIVPLYVIYEKLNLTGSYLSLVLYYETFELPFVTFMMRGFFTDVPRELDDAARVDGCSRWLAFRKIILPLVLPGLATVSILISIGSWGEYFGALIFSGPSTQTGPVDLANYIGLDASDWGALAAGSLFLIVPVLILITFLQRGYLRRITSPSTGS
jgi:multiple sugar transport system permease protein